MALEDVVFAANITGNQTKLSDTGRAITYSISNLYSFALSPGFGSGEVDKYWDNLRTVGISSNDDIDLAGVLIDALGDAVTFVKVKAIWMKASELNTNDLVVGGAGATQFLGPFDANTHKVHIPSGGALAFFAPKLGWTVTPGTDIWRVANGAGTTSDYEIGVMGTSA